ncbi:brachyurin-like [Aedes albopictus]|uniref:Peptidase S1 domain-containing protein n=1 Tax=Aedes albopictus TaxID=7160 RepID=A0ABM1Z4T4_AEDAL|nr:brachyurin-like [Aedes albopictus]XP_029726078.1 brachyurin-like [Aedes albopictus]
MKTFAVVLACLALVSASAIDFSNVKRVEELDIFWEQLDPQLQVLRPSPESRIVNGQEARPNQFPYQALVLSFFDGGNSGLCGGTILTPNFVMTAAHCVVIGTVATHGTVVLGAHNRQVVEATQQRFSFDQINAHPSYIAALLRNDIATVRLSAPAVFNEFVQPIDIPALSDTRTFAGMTGIISGFGRTSDETGSPASDVVMYSSNPILTNADCAASWNSILIGAQNICLSGAGGRSVCNGDSGGPLAVQDSGRSLQVGIASFVHVNGCASGMPSGFVRVSHYLQWIADNSDVVLRN